MKIIKKHPFLAILILILTVFPIFRVIGGGEEENIINEKNNNAFSEGESITITDPEEMKKYSEQNNIPLKSDGQKIIRIETNYQGEKNSKK
ncbi:hypothetical protein [Lederbergia citrea]|uniref:hypothetical protein n=1 Tax=Lederbergia citrea TaxID=2833581 RepID=UPI001BC92507|nr:hypothetical protein [Lederbergia citrea]MBS4176880.1 hypothetical protein [Lederbergia citrea]